MMRVTDDNGFQIVTVDEKKKYAYAWNGAEPLAVGDLVRVPGNWLNSQESTARVTGLGNDTWKGDCVLLLGRVEE